MISLNWVKDYIDIKNEDLKELTVETVMRFGLHVRPYGAVIISHVLNTLSMLSRGSPCPIKTIFVSVANSGSEYIWFKMSAGVNCA